MAVATRASEKFGRRRGGAYYLPGGRVYPSVTTILDRISKPALVNWAAKTAASLVLEDPDRFDTAQKAAAGIYQSRDKAADRGSLVHSLAEALLKGNEVDTDGMTPEIQGYYRAFWAWVRDAKPTPLYTEANVFSDKHKYAGTTDLIAAFDKRLRIVDLKTTKNIYAEVRLQLAAYRNADFILPRGDGAEPIPMPPVSECEVVLLRPEGTYAHEVFDGGDADFLAFRAVKVLHEWLSEREG